MTGDQVRALTPEQRKKWSLQGKLRALRERAVAADQGAWSRSHSIIQSWHRSKSKAVVIALAEGFQKGTTLSKYIGTFWDGDPVNEAANCRHITGAQPQAIIRLVDSIWDAFPELKEYD